MSVQEQDLVVATTSTQTPEPLAKGNNANSIANNLTTSMPDVQVKTGQRAPRRTFSTAYKLKILDAYDTCDNALSRGALLRKEGLYHSRLSTWRKQLASGKLDTTATPSNKKSVNARKSNQALKRENQQLQQKLSQAEGIIELQKKIAELFGTHILPPDNSESNS